MLEGCTQLIRTCYLQKIHQNTVASSWKQKAEDLERENKNLRKHIRLLELRLENSQVCFILFPYQFKDPIQLLLEQTGLPQLVMLISLFIEDPYTTLQKQDLQGYS